MKHDDPNAVDAQDRALIGRLLRAAEVEAPTPEFERRLIEGLAGRAAARSRDRNRWVRRLLVLAATMAVAVASMLIVRGRARSRTSSIRPVETRAEEIDAERPLSANDAPLASIGKWACFRAQGGAALLDDFEAGGTVLLPLDGRRGKWCLLLDSDPAACVAVPPLLRPGASMHNRRALRFQTAKLSDWGAALEAKFEPHCYDASAYAGIAFSAKGPGKLYLEAREVRVVSTQAGGSCLHDCYNDHAKRIELSASFRRYEIGWSELRQRGYNMPPLNTRELYSVAFVIHADDTPSDVWLDDVEFLIR